MREQVITQRSVGRTVTGSRSRTSSVSTQRPIRRERAGSAQAETHTSILGRLLGWIPRAVKVVFVIAGIVLLFAGYRAAASAAFFQVRNIDVSGTSKTSPEQVRAIVHRLGSVGVWRADLDQISKAIGELPWVRTAVVSRVLPDGLRVRITERTQEAVVRLSSGRIVWVDDDSALLGDVQPNDPMPDFFIRGWNENLGLDAIDENRQRVAEFSSLAKEFSAAGVSSRLSEIDLTDMSDVRVQLGGQDAEISVRLGSRDLTNHLMGALKKLDEAKNTESGPRIIYVDNALGTRVVLGTDRPIVKPASAEAASGNSKPKPNPAAGITTPGIRALASNGSATNSSKHDTGKKKIDRPKPRTN